jgi:pimeloyl-ACP methyl ester carboxylesterase/dienelactone hydrolase
MTMMKAPRERGSFAVLALAFSIGLPPLLTAQDLSKPIVYSVPGMNAVDARLDIVYKTDGEDRLRMDIYIPPGLAPHSRRPAVLFIHGGPLGKDPSPRAKDWGVYRSYGRLMAASGLVGVTFDHRYASLKASDLKTSFADVEEALRFIRANAATYRIDAERIALWGFSGGGPHLSLGLRGNRTYIRCLVSYYAMLDFGGLPERIGETPETLRDYTPLACLDGRYDYLPPVLIARAGLDSPDINRSVERFVARMFALNGDIHVLSHPLGRHGFDAYDDDDQTRDVIAATIAFLKSRLNRATAFEAKRARAAAELQTLLAEGKIGVAREFVRASLRAPGDKAVADVLVSESRLTGAGQALLGSDPGAALEAFRWAVELEPRSANAHLGLAMGLAAADRTEEAVAEVKAALDLLEKDMVTSEMWKRPLRERATALLESLKGRTRSQAPPSPPLPPPPQAVNIPPLAIKGTEHMIDVGGRRLHCFVYGSGGPTVVLVSGFQAPQAYWNPVVPGIAEIATVVTYDRAGYGRSERGDLPVHGRQTADDLHVLLGKLGVPKPYLLVGHSYGGRIVRLFAAAYPAETAGLVLEEAGHEDLPDAQLEALTGKDRETLAAMIAPYRATVPNPRTETDYMAETVEQLRRSGALPHVPLTVITAASRGSGLPTVFSPENQARLTEVAMAMQKKLTELVPGGEQVLVEGAGHNVHLDKPEAVLAPIRAMIARLRAKPAK